jgi:hypothetical protein
MPSNRRSRLMARLQACCTAHSPVGCAVTPPRCILRVLCSMNTRTIQPFQQDGVHVQEVNREDPGGQGSEELPPRRTGAARDRRPRHAGSPRQWMTRPSRRAWLARRGSGGIPHSGFSLARRTARRPMLRTVGGSSNGSAQVELPRLSVRHGAVKGGLVWLVLARFLIAAGLGADGTGSRWSALRTNDLDAVPSGPDDGAARKRARTGGIRSSAGPPSRG